MTYGSRLKTAITQAKCGRKDLAAAIGISVQAIGDVINGKSNALTAENSAKAAAFLRVSSSWLATGEGEMLPRDLVSTNRVGGGLSIANTSPGPDIKGVYPLISSVQAGAWAGLCEQFQAHQAQDWLPSTKNLGECGYMLRVDGKSMENPGGRHNFAEGMVLHVNPDLTPEPGQYVVVRRNGTQEATFKRYVLIDGAKYLEAINPDWPKDMKYLPLQPGDEWCGVVTDASFGNLP